MILFLPAVAEEIQLLLQLANDSNFDSIYRELCQFVEYGSEGSILLLQTCLNQVKNSSDDTLRLQQKKDLASSIFKYLLDRPNFCTIFSEALGTTLMEEESLEVLSDTLNLSVAEKVGVGLALSESGKEDIRMKGQKFCTAQIEELCANPSSILSSERIQEILVFLYRSEGLSKHMKYFTKSLSVLQLKESSFFWTALMLTDGISTVDSLRQLYLFSDSSNNEFEAVLAEIENERSMAGIMMELGYGCSVSTPHCKEVLTHFLPFSEVTLANLLGTIARTHIGLEDTQNIHSTFYSALGCSPTGDSTLLNSWNIDVLADSIKQLAPETDWMLVIENLDHEGFNIPDEASFSLLMSLYNKICQDPFPLHAICGSVWKNAEGQLSFLRHAVAASRDLFTFSHCSRKLEYTDSLHLPDGNGNEAWVCLDLLEVLCQLAERGHATSVRLMLEYPIVHFPEVLLVGIAQIDTAYHLLQYEVTSAVFPSILNDSTKYNIIHHLWHVNPNVILRGFMDSHADPTNLFRVLDICQELKVRFSCRLSDVTFRFTDTLILPSVLDMAPFSFSIKLAAIASRKEYINFEKWLNENLSVYKDAFFEECLKFLKEILYDVANNVLANSLQQSQHAVLKIYQETSSILFKVFQVYSGRLASPQLFEEFQRLYALPNPIVQDSVAMDLRNSEGSSDVIEAEANAYFHQMFSGQLTIDAMVQMLARFKESPEKREQLIFECMIANLFEEYKFFPKYPDKQLKLAAVLFGSLIKHQLVTHLTLGMALRGVLDALRKSVDSKMFVFGTKALEQFIDRLVEWPQYCNHILQISHLRGTHAELVSVIERTLARISSNQSDFSGSITLPADQQQVSPASLETMEPSESSWPLSSGSSVKQVSPYQLPRHHGFLDDRITANVTSVNYTMSQSTHSGQSSVVSTPADSNSSHKATASQSLSGPSPHNSAGVASGVSPSGFSRPSHTAGIRQPSYIAGFGAALNIGTLLSAALKRETQIEDPALEVQDKIFFLINNISTTNMDSKAREFNEVLKEQYYPWFAQYMVMKRASIEPNFHDLYLAFLDKINSKPLNKEIINASYENCKVLLSSNRIKSTSEERSLLKNLGSWLGKLTIGKERALLAKQIDPKSLIVEVYSLMTKLVKYKAYEKGLMIAVIPFTSKILEPCHNSLAYKPPNPWTMGILGLLVEIYNQPNLKMNLKFDIEVLFKNLNVEMKDVVPTSLLKDKVREVEGNPDFSKQDVVTSQPPVIAEVNSGVIPKTNQTDLELEINNTSHSANHHNVLTQYAGSLHLPSNTMVEDDRVGPVFIPERVPSAKGSSQIAQLPSPFALEQLRAMIPNFDSFIIINPKLTSMGLQLQYSSIMRTAIDNAITEIISPVIQRSVTIASRTTKELVLKDYALESDDNVICRAARLMVGTLAGSLAHVTCKEPLRLALSNHVRSILQKCNVNGERADQMILILTTDHLDLGCALIEHVASEKAVELIDGEIGPSFASIRKQRELPGSAFYDAITFGQGPFGRVPEALRPKPGHLSNAQQRVYNDFIRNVWKSQPSQSTNVESTGPPGMSGGSVGSPLSHVYGSSSGQLNSSMFPTTQVASGFGTTALPLDPTQEEQDRGPMQLISVSSPDAGVNDSCINPIAEIRSTTSSSPANVTSADLIEQSTVSKESGASLPISPTATGSEHAESLLTTGDALDKYQQVAQKLETLIAKNVNESDLQVVVAEVSDIILKCVSRDEAALAVAQKVFKSLYENGSSKSHVSSYIAILEVIRDVCKLVVKELTSWVIYSDEDRKFNKEITVGLIRSELLNLADYNVHLAKLMDGGRNKAATEFGISLVHSLLVEDPGFSTSELYNVMDVLTKMATKPGSPESLQQMIDTARNASSKMAFLPGLTASKEEKTRQSRDKKIISGRSLTNREEYNTNEFAATDPPGLHDKVSHFFDEWCHISDLPVTNDTIYSQYISQLQRNGWLKGDDITERVFRIFMMQSVALCHDIEQVANPGPHSFPSTQQLQYLSFFAIDACAKLVVLVLKYCSVDQGLNKYFLLPKILSVTTRVIQKDSEDKKISFNPRPYFRLFVNLLLDLTSAEPVLDGANFQVLTSFANAFHALQPLRVPGWSFAWLELVSHRSFMPKLLMCNSPKGWPFFQRLLVDLFKFMEPYLRNAELGKPVNFLYKGTLRVLLVLLHDFPEFLCDYHFSFCDVIPPSCIQMRNIILSAFPRNMRLPDPSTPNLKIDLLAEISLSPRILSDVDSALKAKQIKHDIDEYLKTRSEGSFLTELKQRLLLPQSEASLAGTRYNVPLINSLVLYIGMQAIQQLQSKSPQHAPAQQMTRTPPLDIFLVGAAMDIFQSLINNLDTEGRYLFLNAVANQLRYPNNHTHYFSFVLLFLFAEASQDIVQEQITRVLLERLIVNRPHPWGLLITFIELIKNPRYSFWSRPFTRLNPEVEKLFDSVSISCGGPRIVDDVMMGSGIPDGNN